MTAYAGLPLDTPASQPAAPIPPVPAAPAPIETPTASYARYLWAVLIARIYEVLPLICPECRSEMRLIACVTESEPLQRILLHIGEPATPPPISPARSPPVAEAFDWDQSSANSLEQGEPAPVFEYDQTVSW